MVGIFLCPYFSISKGAPAAPPLPPGAAEEFSAAGSALARLPRLRGGLFPGLIPWGWEARRRAAREPGAVGVGGGAAGRMQSPRGRPRPRKPAVLGSQRPELPCRAAGRGLCRGSPQPEEGAMPPALRAATVRPAFAFPSSPGQSRSQEVRSCQGELGHSRVQEDFSWQK